MNSVVLESLQEPSYTVREAFRTLRTNLQFSGDDIKTIVFTSTIPNEGKTTIVVQLANSLVELGKRVLVVDADMRKSVMMGRVGAKSTDGKPIKGLSHLLSGQAGFDEVVYKTSKNGLFMIFSGTSIPNPTEILEKKHFDTLIQFGKNNFDYVLIDCPPMGAAIDAAVIAEKCDGAIFVIAQGEASGRAINDAKRQLENSGVKILGAVFNKVSRPGNRYGYYSRYNGYYNKYYGYYSQSEE